MRAENFARAYIGSEKNPASKSRIIARREERRKSASKSPISMPPPMCFRGGASENPRYIAVGSSRGNERDREIAGENPVPPSWMCIRRDLVARTPVLSGIDRPRSGRGFAG